MAYKQNNPFSRKASSPFNQNGEELDLTPVRGKRYYTRPIGDDELYDHDNVTGRMIDERTGQELVSNKYGGRGARVDYLPAQETLRRGVHDQYMIDDKTYNTARAMVRDSLNLVNKGRGITAASLYGENLGENLRQSTGAGNFHTRIMKNLKGIDDQKNLRDAKIMKDRGGSGHGVNAITGEVHHDFGGGSIIYPGDTTSYKKRKGFIN